MSIKSIAITGIIVAAALAVPLVMQQQTINQLRQDNDDLKAQVAKIVPLQAQLDQATQDAASAGGSAESQKHELVRLRAEVAKLRGQGKDLVKAQVAIQALTQRLSSETAAGRDQAAALQAETQRRQAIESVQRMNACINNLRLIDAAKQQWALENKKQAADTPTMDDLRPYFGGGPNNTNVPTCPDGGVYTVGTVGEKPACGIQSHVLP
jgi:hypothetical protein